MAQLYAVWCPDTKRVYFNLLKGHTNKLPPGSIVVKQPRKKDGKGIALDRILEEMAAQTGNEEWWDAVDENPLTMLVTIDPNLAR